MSNPKNFGNTVKEEMSDLSFVQNEGNLNVNKELLFTSVPKQEERNNQHLLNSTDVKTELYGKIEQNCFTQCVKQEKYFQSYAQNLIECQEDSLTTNNYNVQDVQAVKKKYQYINNVKEELTIDEGKNYADQDERYNTDFAKNKVKSSTGKVYKFTSVYEESIPGSSSNRRGSASVRGEKIKSIKRYEFNECHKMSVLSADIFKNPVNATPKDIKKHECNQCMKRLSSAQNLRLHIDSVHRGNKKYECNECHKLFSHRHNLKTHILGVHMKYKSVMCNECGKLFLHSGNLKWHIESVHKGIKLIKKYECYECHKLFSLLNDLKKHIYRLHKKN